MIVLIAQGLGFIALFFLILHFQLNKRSLLMIFKLLSFVFFTAHFFFLGALTGSAMNFLGVVRTILFKYRIDKKWLDNRLWLYLFLILYFIVGMLTWQGIYSLLVIIGSLAGAIAYWCKETKHIRWIALISPPCWIVYNIIVGSYAGILASVFGLVSLIIAIIRFDILKESEHKLTKHFFN